MVHKSREYELIVRQEPKQARMCGIGTKGELPGLVIRFFISFHLVSPLSMSVAHTLLRPLLCNMS